jgi:hypothetical protein
MVIFFLVEMEEKMAIRLHGGIVSLALLAIFGCLLFFLFIFLSASLNYSRTVFSPTTIDTAIETTIERAPLFPPQFISYRIDKRTGDETLVIESYDGDDILYIEYRGACECITYISSESGNHTLRLQRENDKAETVKYHSKIGEFVWHFYFTRSVIRDAHAPYEKFKKEFEKAAKTRGEIRSQYLHTADSE